MTDPDNSSASFNPALLDVIKLATDGYALAYNNGVMSTPRGIPLIHPTNRLLEHIQREASLSGELKVTRLSSYSIFCTQKDFIEQGNDIVAESFYHLVAQHETLVRRVAGPEQVKQLQQWQFVLDYLEEAKLKLPIWLQTDEEAEKYKEKFVTYLKGQYEKLAPEQRAVITSLVNVQGVGVILPMLLVLGRCTSAEYAESAVYALAVQPRTFEPEWDEYRTLSSELSSGAEVGRAYLTHYEEGNEQEVLDLIAAGESTTVEFKATLLKDIEKGGKNPDLTEAVIKTIAGFLNSYGGRLLIGVSDKGEILGTEIDAFKNWDKFYLRLSEAITDSLGIRAARLVSVRRTKVYRKTVCLVSAPRSADPVFAQVKSGKDSFFVRQGPRTVRRTFEEAEDYIARHFLS